MGIGLVGRGRVGQKGRGPKACAAELARIVTVRTSAKALAVVPACLDMALLPVVSWRYAPQRLLVGGGHTRVQAVKRKGTAGEAVHDHIIVGKDGHASLKALKLI